MRLKFLNLLLATLVFKCESAKILAFYPTPSLSHQVVFRELTIELIKQGHEVTVITTDPAYSKANAPKNLTEVDIHDLSYGMLENMRKFISKEEMKKQKQTMQDVNMFYASLFEIQITIPEIQNILFNKKEQFDVIFVEEVSRISIAISHIFDAPVILFSSFGGITDVPDILGAHTHPILYPSSIYKRLYNLTFWEKLERLYDHYLSLLKASSYEEHENKILRKYFGAEIPPIRELYNNVHMLFLNTHSIWVDNQPVPPNIVYLGGFHQKKTKELPQDLKTILDSSKQGVIYVSFGTNALSSILPMDKIEVIAKVLSQLPYDVLWKWDQDDLPGKSENIKLSKWLPQSDLLKHPNVKLFITQAGLQSTDEAITAGVPLLAFPVLGDQWYNAEKYVKHGIGKKILFDEVTEDLVKNAVTEIIKDESYRKNINRLYEVMHDQQQTPMERAIFWVNYVIRHKGAKELRAASAYVPWTQYYEIDLFAYCLKIVLLVSILLSICLFYSYRLLSRLFNAYKVKQN